MKYVYRSAPMMACAALGALAALAGGRFALAEDSPRILGESDLNKLSEKTEDQLEAARAATRKYRDISVALAEGFIQGSPDIPGEGFHYLNPARLDCKFDPAHPEILLYAFLPGQTQLKLVALEYAIPFACMPATGPAPAGFAGNLDVWSNDEPVPFWTVNAWIYFRNPNGIFVQVNPLVLFCAGPRAGRCDGQRGGVCVDSRNRTKGESDMARAIFRLMAAGAAVLAFGLTVAGSAASAEGNGLDARLSAVLHAAGFTGRVEQSLPRRLGRPVNRQLADLGRLLWFDKSGGLHSDNTCGGCHSPATGFGDSQSIAIGIQNNNLVGPHRSGPRNQRRTPAAVNVAFYPKLMWNGRFASLSGDPFDNSAGFSFPPPEGTTRFGPNDPIITQLLIAQAHMPPTELVEVAGFTGTRGTIGSAFDPFDDGLGSIVPPPDASGFRNEPIRQAVLERLNSIPAYRQKFGALFPEVAAGAPIDFSMFARAIAEFEFTLVFANAPVDRYARGDTGAMSDSQKRGALIFFGKGNCVQCHAVAGQSNEMFSDFRMHVIGVPQVAPAFGVGKGNVIFDGPGANEDFGLEQITGNSADRYKFRSSPLRNAALQPTFFHNGAFTRLEDAIRHHLDVARSVRDYDPITAGLDNDLTLPIGPMVPVLARLDPLLATPLELRPDEFRDLLAFVRDGLLDERARKENLCKLVPRSVPSGFTVLQFERCPAREREHD